MTRLADLELLLRTADLGSLTAAARALDWSPAAASAAVKRLEAQWGVAVFVRTTRSLRLSAEGERLLPHLRQALQCIGEAQAEVAAQRSTLRGGLQVAMPSDLGRNVLLPWLEAFQQRHPELALRVHLSDRNTDLMRAPIDAAIRYGTPADASLVALPLAPDSARVLVASPAYVAAHGAPETLAQLCQHEALRFMLNGEVPRCWRFCIDGQWHEAPVSGRHSANDGEVVKRWALAGLGIAYKSRLDVAAELDSGRLLHLRPDWGGEPSPLYMVVPGRRQLTPAARALRECLLQQLAPLQPAATPRRHAPGRS
ncbi:LysR family transcriptional regulator [Aquabacterium sp. OR-4]|uniref:LysR family transcriptional regulator n=1 Tax=Aquabacterium sp. OR-4 TaxID=2978127 RepID=UPI0021B2228E|nr:LysR family transcriptional regulator [Aquabacterium sp. OR-4]MDT7838177.1 LysR family transcriptional regulator [Aquabacterium sp. OR-4]